MGTIYVARHGQDADNAAGILNGRRDLPLTEIGISQASHLARWLVGEGIALKRIYTSPLKRAELTAKIVAEAVQAPVTLDSMLVERDFGEMEGKRVADVEKLCAPDIIKTDTVTYFLTPEGAETFPDLFVRARKFLVSIYQRHYVGDVLCVTHGDIGKMLYAAHYHLPWRSVLKSFHFGNSELLVLEEGDAPEKPHVLQMRQFNH